MVIVADPPQTASFLSALAALQAEAPTLRKDKVNPHFGSKFAGLDTVVEAIQPLLTKHGLVWITMPDHDEHGPTLNYRLALAETGDGLTGSMPLMLTKQDSQGLGSALTYARRYALVSVLNLIADDDDDGNASAGGQVSAGSLRNLQGHARGMSTPAIIAAYKAVGLTIPESPWAGLTRIPEDKAQQLYDALQAARTAEGR